MTTPNFLVIGDLKAGSTSIYHYLQQHPDVFMPGVKELRYFAFDPDNPYHVMSQAYRVRTYEDYLRSFDGARGERAVGEASPNYIRSPIAAERIKASLPDVTIVVSLRNPADRLYSAYQMDFREGRSAGSFGEMAFRNNALFIKGNYYWADLKRFFDRFPRDRIRIVLFDDLIADAGAVARELYRFLGVDHSFSPDLEVKNEGGVPHSKLAFSLIMAGKKHLKHFGRPPAALLTTWGRVKRASLRKVPIDPKVREKILEVCRDDILRTQDLVGRDLSAWLK
jgi:hypothetical protein